MARQIRERVTTTLVIILAVAFLAFVFMRFRARMDTELNASTATYLSGNVDALAAAFQTKLADQLVMLESQTRYFSDVDLTDYNAMKGTIMSTRGMEAFTSIGVASRAGSTMSYQGKSSGNILLRDYFQNAMKGQSAISQEPTLDEFGNEVLVLAVPIRQREGVVGVIYGTFTKDALSELLRTVRFGEQSANVLITGDGTILARTLDTDLIDPDSERLQDAIPGLAIEATAEGQYYTYDGDGGTDILVLRPVGYHDWYFGMIVPRAIVSEQSDRVLRYVLAFFDNGFRCVTTTDRPVRRVSDMAGLNIRTPDNQIVMEAMSELGARPRSYPFAQLRQALVDGDFDAQENPIPVIYNNGLYEVQKYLSITNHSYDAMPLTIRQDVWQRLPEAYQATILAAAGEAQATNRQMVARQTEDFVALLEEKGMGVEYPDLEAFAEATKGVMGVFENVYGEELLAVIDAL